MCINQTSLYFEPTLQTPEMPNARDDLRLPCKLSALAIGISWPKREKYIMRRKTAKEILADSLRELAETKKVDKITIKDITSNCGYSPATFYRQFKDKYDLIAWDYARRIGEIMDPIGRDGYTWKQALLDSVNYHQKEKKYLKNLLLHTTGLDSFICYMTETHFQHLKDFILKVSGRDALEDSLELCIRFYCLGAVHITCEWIFGKHQASIQQMAELFEYAVPTPLFKYLR